MPILTNATINTSRSTYSSGTQTTGTAQPHLTGTPVHIMPFVASAYKILPEAALQSSYVAKADSGTDIVEGDIVTSITLPDGITPWPGLNVGTNSNEMFRVSYVDESTPWPLPHRMVYIARIRGGGKVY